MDRQGLTIRWIICSPVALAIFMPAGKKGTSMPVTRREKRSVPLYVWMVVSLGGCSQGEPLPNGYAIFFASGSEAALVKPATKGGECLAGPHITELGTSGNYIFGRIEPEPGAPPHPDHAPGFFVIDSATDKGTTGLDRETWLAQLKAVGVDSPKLHPPEYTWPKKY